MTSPSPPSGKGLCYAKVPAGYSVCCTMYIDCLVPISKGHITVDFLWR